MLTSLAPAKINLVLEVLGRREDGYHEIRSLFQTISLYDVVSFELAEKVTFTCSQLALQTRDNLVVRSAELLRETAGCQKGVEIRLEKRIPWGVGLGGGSSDAAATLLALNEIWELRLAASELFELAAKLGSDVPFFLYGGMALAEGRGEEVRPLPSPMVNWFVLLVPPLPKMPNKTQQLYGLLDAHHFTGGQFVNRALEALPQTTLLFNVFEGVAFEAFPGLRDYWQRFGEAGADSVHLVGSGSALFTLADNETRGLELYRCLCGQGLEAYLVSNITPEVVNRK